MPSGDLAHLPSAAATDTITAPEIDYVPLPRVTVLKGIAFDLNSSEINTASRPLLAEVLGRLKSTPNVEAVEIQGHTDDSGEEPFNRRLSLQRARAVRDFFMNEGYPPGKLGVMGFGSTRSLSGNETPEGRAANRRIEIHLIRRVPG